MTTAYIVMGTTGEYSDRRAWAVAVYLDEEKAKTHVLKAGCRARELEQWIDAEDEPWRWSDDPQKPTNEYDPHMEMQSTGTSYFINDAPLRQDVPS